MMYKNLTESVSLKIQPTLESLAAPIDSEPVSVSTGNLVRTMGLVNHGRCHVRIDLRSDVIPLESPFKFTVFVDNDSDKKIKGLRVVLHQFVVFDPFHKGNGCFTTWTYPLIKQNLDKDVAQGIVNGKPILLTLTIPELANALPSMSSYYIHSLGYRLAVEVSFGLSSRVKADVPVRVVRKGQVVSAVSTSKLLCLT